MRSRSGCRRDNHTDTIAQTTSSQLARGCAAERDHTNHEKRRSPDVHRQNMLTKIHDHDRVAGAIKFDKIRHHDSTRHAVLFLHLKRSTKHGCSAWPPRVVVLWSQVVKSSGGLVHSSRKPSASPFIVRRFLLHVPALEVRRPLIKMMARVPSNAARLINPRFRDFP